MLKVNYNPDVLSCLANLSNDEVFTPPQVVNQMLDLLPASLWKDKNARFLDPVCKSGVFLREIAKRLIVGLEDEIPDLQKRVNHIFTNQLYAIAITELTSLLSRRSVYCSKKADSEYSICNQFEDIQGNIVFNKTKHTWKDGKCEYCGAGQETYDRDADLEAHAYEFIHTDNPERIFKKMKFDVIVGNPPYQLNDGGGMGTSAMPIYQKFVHQAKKLNPRYLTMIIPSRWYSGGKGLDEFRSEMLEDSRITKITDYFDSTECFPGVDISGGVCYFLWERDRKDSCEVATIRNGVKSTMVRPLLEKDCDSFIRFNEAVGILRKIQKHNEKSILDIVSARNPFGFIASTKSKNKSFDGAIKIHSYPNDGYVHIDDVIKNIDLVDKYKVYISKAYGERGSFPYKVTGKPFIGEKGTCCSETYLLIGPFESRTVAENMLTYMCTKFFRFLVLQKKNTQNAAKGVYSFVPLQNLDEPWDDQKLYKKYNFSEDEIAFIESMIRPME